MLSKAHHVGLLAIIITLGGLGCASAAPEEEKGSTNSSLVRCETSVRSNVRVCYDVQERLDEWAREDKEGEAANKRTRGEPLSDGAPTSNTTPDDEEDPAGDE